METKERQLKAAASRFATEVGIGAHLPSSLGIKENEVPGSLKTTVVLLEEGGERVCIVASDFPTTSRCVSDFYRDQAAEALGIDRERVLFFDSHAHSIALLIKQDITHYDYCIPDSGRPPVELLPVGELFLSQLKQNLGGLPGALEPVEVLWAQGDEGRITYNRKGRRADGSTYFMREEDRVLVGQDFNGDIDREAPLVVLRGEKGSPVAALLQYTGHPVTSYHPENPVVYGDFPTVAADLLGRALGGAGEPVPVAFLQGCCGDVNAKEMFCGGVGRAEEFGRLLGESAVEALSGLKPSVRKGMDFVTETVSVPLAPLPAREVLEAEAAEMRDFARRASEGDENTLSCVGLNFPRALTPKYRAALVRVPLEWVKWALELYGRGKENEVMKSVNATVNVLRLGDVAVAGMPFEPFQGIGRRMRAGSPYPLTIPCGYVNGSHGYLTDSANTGDREYMSAFYRYTRFRPPYAKPAGDVIADRVAEILNGFAGNKE